MTSEPTPTTEHKNSVRPDLTPNTRTKTTVENKAFDAFARRILRAYARRVSSGDIEALAMLAGLQEDLDYAIANAVCGLRDFGYSWTDVAARLGVAKQTAHERWTVKKATPRRATRTPDVLDHDTLFDSEENLND
ncbi:hypothetical protein Rhe02_83680 [Rhizocola hellebori]|uniref:Helix-turn-helix DNA binding domain protein n=1 Tax=Rhizocola hellebori TaxID=1392758 RepID=A0A8J3VLP6_9ACTN|nr:hypothetical protein [Rhizocola hellebori]GIH10301.1 hypothetical protein Rhe02_83680 [Rhizocola hellebori]